MLDHLLSAEETLEVAARDFDPSACGGDETVAFLEKLGAIRRLTDGMIAKAAKRLDDTAEHTRHTDRSAAELCARVTGVSTGEAKRAIEVAAKLEALPATDAAVRAGKLSSRATDLIVGA